MGREEEEDNGARTMGGVIKERLGTEKRKLVCGSVGLAGGPGARPGGPTQ
jgi:hypothetical protein